MNSYDPDLVVNFFLILIIVFLLILYYKNRRIEKNILKSELRFRKLAETSTEGLVIHNKDILQEANDQFYEMFQFHAKDLIGTSFISRIFPDKVAEVIHNRSQSGNIGPYEALAKRRDGSRFPVKIITRKPVKKNQPFRVTVFQDMSEKKHSSEILMQSDQKYRRLINAMNEGMMVVDENNTIQFANPSMLKLLEITEEEILGLRVETFLRGENLKILAKQIALRKKGFSSVYHLTWTRHNGQNVYTRVSPHGYHDLEGNFKGSFAVITDLTASKEMEKQLVQAQKMEAIGTLAGGIAHDFNNILSAILGYAQIAKNKLPADSNVLPSIDKVYNAGIRASDLVRQILAFSRKTDHDLKPLKIQFVIKEVLKLLRASIPVTIEIRENVDSDCHAVMADSTQIHQIVMNLCTNSYHAMREEGGILSIGLKNTDIVPIDSNSTAEFRKSSFVELTISDTGSGIDHLTTKQIFDPYFTTKEKGEGTGLGLAIVQSIVHNYGGEIRVESKPGEGTTFRIYLPADHEAQKPVLAKKTLPESSGHAHILVVDDEEILTLMFQDILEGRGYQVTPVSSSIEALELIINNTIHFDLIITDMTMPTLNGIELTKKILKHDPEFPVILCTGYSDQITEKKAQTIGIKKLLMKPVLEEDLVTAIQNALVHSIKN